MPRVTKAQLDRRAAALAEAAELSRRAATLRDEVKQIEKQAAADLEASGRDSVTRGGYTLRMVEGRASVSWKSELVSRLGGDVASEIQANAPKPQKLEIAPPLNQSGC